MNYENEIRRYLGEEKYGTSSDIILFYKGRIGLYSLLKSMGVGHGDEVCIPAYTCVVVPNAIKYLSANPKYVDIELRSFSVDVHNLKSSFSSKTRVAICQNTYGLSYMVDEIADLCRASGIHSIEDCTHGYSGTYKGKPNGSWCDAAFYSSQWNKPFSTGLGGYALVNNLQFAFKTLEFASSLPQPSLKTQIMLWTLLRLRSLVNPSTYYALVEAYRYLSKHNLVTGSSSGQEIEGIEMPKDYLLRMSGIQKRAAIRALKRLPAANVLRKTNGALYTKYLAIEQLNHVAPEFHADHLFLKYPLLVQEREAFVARARISRIPLGDWFRSPLHPVEGDLSKWGFESERYPNAVFASAHVVNLPTDTETPERVLDFLDANKGLIFDATVDGRLPARVEGR
jgi:perosamine synthetase